MFYEADRIIHKQKKYVKRQALDVVNSFVSKTLSLDEVIACIDLMLEEDINETRADILKLAKNIINNKRESNEKSITI